MRPDVANRWETWAWLVWIGLLAVLSARPMIAAGKHTVYPIYTRAAEDWLGGANLYGQEQRPAELDEYRYSPVVAVAMIPWAALPVGLGESIWRLLGGWLLLAGFVGFTREFLGERSAGERAGLLWALLPLAIGSVNNGQVNVHMVGLLLMATSAAARQRWNVATLCLTVSIFCKLYPIALALLLVVMMPRALGWRLLLAIVAGLALPFLTQAPGYVAGEYGHWLAMLGDDDRRGRAPGWGYRDLDMLLRWGGLTLTRGDYMGLQLATALGLAGLAWTWRHGPEKAQLRLTFDLACCWMILFGPATESCTYILLAPTLACALTESWTERHVRPASPWLLGPALVLFGISVVGTGCGWPRIAMGVVQVLAACLLCLERLTRSAGRQQCIRRPWAVNGA